MPNPLYKYENLNPAFHLRYTWTGWPTSGTEFPPRPDDHVFEELDAAWRLDHLKRIATTWNRDKIQFTCSTLPDVPPTLFVARIKGRLQYALRLSGTQVRFSRKVAFRAVGKNHTREVQNYIQTQIEKEPFVDHRFSEMLNRFTIHDRGVALNEPSDSNSGRYWYNLHVVLVVASRGRIRSENDFAKLDQSVQATAKKHGYQIGSRAWMPDHLHLALRGNIAESPADIALSLMNNSAYSVGQNAIWKRGFYVGTFSEYDIGGVVR